MAQPILPADCRTQTGYDYKDLLALTGVFGIHGHMEFLVSKKLGRLKHRVFFDDDDNYLTVQITSNKIIMLKIKILDRDTVYIDVFRLEDAAKGGNVGFKRLIKQVEEMRKLGFKKITLWAFGNYKEVLAWDGYIVWGKYGFTMYEQREIKSFLKQMADDRLSHCSKITILVSTKEGTALWKHIGSSWHGEFELDENSYNVSVYDKYGKDRNLLQ